MGKVIVIVVLIAILASLGSALVAMLRGRSGLTLQALSLRVALSIGLFLFLMIAYATGLISPHGL
ncbi:MAG: DUF2909 domain-containing protein [Pseudomonadota bacterium]|nr:DUF2909 domain-containing protein [Pseudomonadota bacterium]